MRSEGLDSLSGPLFGELLFPTSRLNRRARAKWILCTRVSPRRPNAEQEGFQSSQEKKDLQKHVPKTREKHAAFSKPPLSVGILLRAKDDGKRSHGGAGTNRGTLSVGWCVCVCVREAWSSRVRSVAARRSSSIVFVNLWCCLTLYFILISMLSPPFFCFCLFYFNFLIYG